MPEPINLNRVRKARAKTEKDKTAQANRVLHGTPKTLRQLGEARKDKAERDLAANKLDKSQPDN